MSAEYQPNLSFVSQIPAEFLKLREYSANPDISWIFLSVGWGAWSRGRAPAPEAENFLYFYTKEGQMLRILMKRYKVKYARLCYVIGL